MPLRTAQKITVPLSPLPLGEGRVRGQKDTTVIFLAILNWVASPVIEGKVIPPVAKKLAAIRKKLMLSPGKLRILIALSIVFRIHTW